MILCHIYQINQPHKHKKNDLLLSNLSHYLQKPIKKLKLKKNPNGKPIIDGIHFSISHSKNFLVHAFSLCHPIGIDIESINPDRKVLKLAERYFHSEEFLLLKDLNKQEQTLRFFQLWTQKEALCKLEGGRLWFYLKENMLNSKKNTKEKVNPVFIQSYDKIPQFSLSIASSEEPNEIRFIEKK